MAIPRELERALKEAKGLTQDSREVREGFIFFAIRGTRADGHAFVKDALEKGALYAVVEEGYAGEGLPEQRLIRVQDTRMALGESAHLFFGKPSEKLRVVGVTGTNGKTTVTYIIESVLRTAGYACGVMGTINYRLGDQILGEGRTTPAPVTWHRTLGDMLRKGADSVVAEVSSHALEQRRVWGTRFHGVIFTNLTQDHLDYHKTMDEYFRAKARLFTDYRWEIAVINTDDEWGRKLAGMVEDVVTVGTDGDLRILDFETDFEGSRIRFEWKGKTYEMESSLVGDFQKVNIALSVAYCLEAGIDPQQIREALSCVHVPGRFEILRSEKGFLVVIDYAHTPDAIDNVLKTIRKLSKNRVITVFGAGGDRDRGKRPLMGIKAGRWSDFVILTSDNPRSEDPEEIIEDIAEGFDSSVPVVKEPDRRKAIEKALEIASSGDIVAILGKGHEEYQEVGGIKYPFSDRQVVEELL